MEVVRTSAAVVGAFDAGLDLAASCQAVVGSSCRSVVVGTSSAAVVLGGLEEEFALVVVSRLDACHSSSLVDLAHFD